MKMGAPEYKTENQRIQGFFCFLFCFFAGRKGLLGKKVAVSFDPPDTCESLWVLGVCLKDEVRPLFQTRRINQEVLI